VTKKKNTANLNDVAQHVGLSKSTVSLILNGKAASVGLAQKTVEKVEKAAKELGYMPNYWASSLARRSTRNVTILLGGLSGDWGDQIMFSISQALMAQSYYPLLAADWHNPELFEHIISATIQRQDAGMICHSPTGTVEQYVQLIENKIPLVFLGDIPHFLSGIPEINSVVWDDEQAVKTAIDHLVNTGRRKIAFIGANHGFISDHRRLAAYEKALEEAGLEVRKDWQIWMKVGAHSLAMERDLLERLFASENDRPDALFSLNHGVSVETLQAAHDLGIRIPEDAAIIGLGDFPIIKAAGLSAVREPVHELGEAAVQMVLELIKKPNQQPLHKKISCNDLLIRKTTAG